MCDHWVQRDSRIKVIHQKNGGLSIARNAGLDASTGEYIWFIDSDDWITENAIEHVLSLIKSYPDIEVFISPLIWTYEDPRRNWQDILIEFNTIITGND